MIDVLGWFKGISASWQFVDKISETLVSNSLGIQMHSRATEEPILDTWVEQSGVNKLLVTFNITVSVI